MSFTASQYVQIAVKTFETTKQGIHATHDIIST